MSRDRLEGALLLAAGIAALAAAAQYDHGTLRHLGPGAFPAFVGVVLATLGAAAAVRGLPGGAASDAGLIRRAAMARSAAIAGAVVTFALLIEVAGLLVAAPAVVIIALLGEPGMKRREVLLLAASLTLFAFLVFVWGLGLPLTLWPRAIELP